MSSIDEIDEKSYDDGEAENDVDLDMLPTLLVYRDGDLVHNWVRVDWEAGRSSIRDLLERCVLFEISPLFILQLVCQTQDSSSQRSCISTRR